MKKRKAFISIVCIILALLMLLSIAAMIIAPSAYAASSTEIKGEINDLNDEKDDIQDRIDQIDDEINSLDYEKSNALEKKAKLDEKNLLAQQELDVIQEQIDIIDNLLNNMQEDLTDARNEEEVQKERWLTRVRAMEESSNVGYLEVIFDASSFSDLLTRLDLVNEVMAYDQQLEEQYIAARENVETLEAEAEDMFVENEQRRQEQENKKAQLETDIDAACLIIQQMADDIDSYGEIKEEEKKAQKEIEELIVQKEKELKEAQAREYAEWLAAHPPAAAGGGEATTLPADGSTWMMWPSYTKTITSNYGMRTNPVSGVYKLHSGCDIGASYKSKIWAAAGGTVVKASYGWNGGYGNCVMVNHGNGYTTLYAHMSSIAVSNGQSVSMGQVLGYVGSTGNSTGPHLHFEVRSSSSGKTMNPLGFSYLT